MVGYIQTVVIILPKLHFQNTVITVKVAETVLESLERCGFQIPNSCRSGLCHSCLMQADNQPPPAAQLGLTENQKLQHYFLSCSCIPSVDMSVNLIGDSDKVQGRVVKKELLNKSVLGLFIEVNLRWFPGQYITVWKNEIQGRSYSIASRCETPKIIELHIKRHELGVVSSWLHDDVVVGDILELSKPLGNCFYTDDHFDKSLLLAATGTGLAPLYGIIREALAQNHDKEIILYAAAGEPSGLYYVEELKALAEQYPYFNYHPVVRRNTLDGIMQQDLVEVIKNQFTDLKGWKIFLCGNPDMIKELQRHCFFQGAAINDILVDAFIIETPKEN